MWGWKEISNKDLNPKDIPGPEFDGWKSFDEFALSFDDYHYWGSKGKNLAGIANRAAARFYEKKILPQGLLMLRTCLYFEQRKLHHWGTAPDQQHAEYLFALLEAIRETVAVREALKEPLDWSAWIGIESVAKHEGQALDGGGVFELRAVDLGGTPIAIDRFLGTDADGLLYIGPSRSSIRHRLRRIPSARSKGLKIDPVGYRLFLLDQISSFQASPANGRLECRFAKCDYAREREALLLRSYVEHYGELPPLTAGRSAGVWVDQTAED